VLILSILNPFFLFLSLTFLVRSLRQTRGGRLEGVLLALGFFLLILFVKSLLGVAQAPEMFDVYAEQLEASFFLDAVAYGGLLVCSLFILKHYQRSFISWGEKLWVLLLLASAFSLTFLTSRSLIFYFDATPYTLKSSFLIGMGVFVGVLLIPTYFNYFRTRFFLAWCQIGAPLFLLTGVNYLQVVVETRALGPILIAPTEMARTFCFFLLALGLFSFRRAQRQTTLPEHHFVERQTLSEKESLEALFIYLQESWMALYGSFYGAVNQKGLEKKWNRVAEKEKDPIRFVAGRLQQVASPINLLPQAERLRRYFQLTYEMLVDYCGAPFVHRYLKQLLQELYWPEKDLADTHLLSHLSFGKKFVSEEKKEELSLEELLRLNPLFRSISDEERAILNLRFKRKEVRAGKKIVREGAKGDPFFILAKGECSVRKRAGWRWLPLVHLKPGDFFGEKALLEEGKRAATVQTKTPAVVYLLKKDDFLSVLKKYFDLLPKMKQSLERVDFLKEVPLFSSFSQIQLLYMAFKMTEQKFTAGETVIRQGEKGESFYLIVEGTAQVSVEKGPGQAQVIAHLGKGECFGEMALLLKQERAATVQATTDLTCYQLKQTDFDFLFQECHYNRKRLEKLILRREEDLKKKGGKYE
jgi:CRP-like cAMP-binding protein